HRPVDADHLRPGQAREMGQVAAEIGQQDVLAERVQVHAGVARQPVADDVAFVLHPCLRGAHSGTHHDLWRLAGRARRANVERIHWRSSMLRPLTAALCAALFAGCATTGGTGADGAAVPSATDSTAYASTYRAIAAPPVLITGATVLVGDGRRLENADVLLQDGKVAQVGTGLSAGADAVRVDGSGKWVTPGLIDVHSHLGVYPSPGASAHSDGNEATAPVTAQVWAEHSVWPQDPGFGAALAGGITALQILPGSANLVGGRGVTLR